MAARLLGASLVVLAVVVFVGTALVAILHLPLVLIGVMVIGVLGGVGAGGRWLARGYVVRLDDEGYRVRLVRGAGVTRARWTEVDGAVTTKVSGARCLVLKLGDGRRTTIPVDVLAGDRDDFVRDVQAHLQRGHGLRPV
jgi:hypothetical protein